MSLFPLASFPTINSIKVLWNSATNSSNSFITCLVRVFYYRKRKLTKTMFLVFFFP